MTKAREMYNLEVEGNHDFFVGKKNWLVHNCGPNPWLNNKGQMYPLFKDPRTGTYIKPPALGTDLVQVPKASRVSWTNKERGEFIKEWYDQGYKTPEGGWANYDIHHILPREYGGTNDFMNLIPMPREFHQQVVTPWWAGYK